uniref:Ubinuclein 1 n=1 Tax=Leptobrachium leishanense TaxID=445787 RepID=A0A8C5QPT9_9ANUR
MTEPRREPDSLAPVTATVRIALSLFEPDQKRCPEFCYPELVRKLRKGPSKDKKDVNLLDDAEAQKKEVADLAKRFEEKYGNKKRRRDRMQDLMDMGYGYDESDSFIDNSEAYDELVPASLSTKFGGFYINSGTLQFRQASDNEDDDFQEKKKKPSKKIKEKGDKLKKKKREEEKKSKKAKYGKTGFTALNGTKEKKKKKSQTDIGELLATFQREKETQKNKSVPPSVSTSTLKPASTSHSPTVPPLPPTPPQEAEPAPDPLLSSLSEKELLQVANAIDSLSEKDLDSLLNMPPDKPEKSRVAPPTPPEEFKRPPSIPEGLPPLLDKRIKELTKDAAYRPSFFALTLVMCCVCVVLWRSIHVLSRDLSSSLRSAVFSHLSSILPCSKDTLVKWASRLHLHKQGGRLPEPLQKMKEAVAKAMPEQINKYHIELKVHNEAKYAKMLVDDKEKEHRAGSDEDEEEKSNKKSAGPRKKFQWNEEIRQLLCQLVRLKVEVFESEGNSFLNLEDYLKAFLDVEVKPLWPRGWMQARTLFKETRRVYPHSVYFSSIDLLVKNLLIYSAQTCTILLHSTLCSSGLHALLPSVPLGSRLFSPLLQDNSLDGDLIHNPPSLDAVSEHLTALTNRSSGIGFDFPTSRSGSSVKNTSLEERRKPCPPAPPASVHSNTQTPPPPPPSARAFSVDKPLVLGPEKKLIASGHNAKPHPEVHQGKIKPQPQHQGTAKGPVMVNPKFQPSVKLYPMSNPQGKGTFTQPTQAGGPKSSAPSPLQRPGTPQTKPLKPQVFPLTSPPRAPHNPILAPGFVGKYTAGVGISGQQVYRPSVPRPPAPPASNSGGAGGQNSSSNLNQSPPNLVRAATNGPLKKSPVPPQKLTLVAPQDPGGGGTQGVAKLLTSSMFGVGGNPTTPSNMSQPAKCGKGPALLTPPASPSLTVLTQAYKPNGGKLAASLGIISPTYAIPLHVISFAAEPKAPASKDAIVTGPAPGTFNHVLPRSKSAALPSQIYGDGGGEALCQGCGDIRHAVIVL